MTTPPTSSAAPPRAAVVGELSSAIASAAGQAGSEGTVLRVGIDGRDGAGKSTFADELAAVLTSRAVDVVRATVDRFHQPRAVRYRRGRWSPDGFYLDSYDLAAVRRCLLAPTAPGGDGLVVLGVWDVDRDVPLEGTTRPAVPAGWRAG